MWHGGLCHPAFWHFVGVSVDGIGFGILGVHQKDDMSLEVLGPALLADPAV